MTDIFRFWAKCPAEAHVHPADQSVFDRPYVGHMGFRLDCLPSPYAGPLRTAPLVLLYLSPGYNIDDFWEAKTEAGVKRYVAMRSGRSPLPITQESKYHCKWITERTQVFGSYDALRRKCAILNLGAYHSPEFKAFHSLAALPSCRLMLDWAHDVLFPQAIRGERIVVCMRSAEHWGLKHGTSFGKGLFVPRTARGGHMQHGPDREAVIAAVKDRLASD